MAQKKTLSAKEVVSDIRASATDEFLIKKYGVSEKGLQSLFQKLVAAKIITQSDLDRRAAVEEVEAVMIEEEEAEQSPSISASTGVYRCPSCNLPQIYDFKVCPQCGVIVEKYLTQRDNPTTTVQSKSTPHTPQRPVAQDDDQARNRKLRKLFDAWEAGIISEDEYETRKASVEMNLPVPASGGNLTPLSEIDKVRHITEEAAGRAVEMAQEATSHATVAIKTLFTDPLGGQARALTMLGDRGALLSGIVFVMLFAVSALVLETKALQQMIHVLVGGPPAQQLRFRQIFDLFLMNLVPVSALWMGFTGLGRVFGGTASLSAGVFVTGVALIPLALAFLVATIVGLANMEIIVLASILGLSTTLLILNTAMLDVLHLSTRHSVILTPVLILLSVYLTKVILSAFVFG